MYKLRYLALCCLVLITPIARAGKITIPAVEITTPELVSKHSALRALLIGTGLGGTYLFAKGIKQCCAPYKPVPMPQNNLQMDYRQQNQLRNGLIMVGSGVLVTAGSILAIIYSDKIQ